MTVFATTTITADEVYESGRDGHDTVQVAATEFDAARVSFGEDKYGTDCQHCQHCHETIEQLAHGTWQDSDGHGVCPDNQDYELGDDDTDRGGPHVPETGPNTWCNSASVIADENEDSVTVTISVGDPRGAFAFTVRRIPDTAPEHAGRLVLHTPYPGEGMPHEQLTELRPGTFLIG